MAEDASMADEVMAEAASTVDRFVAEDASTADELVAEASSTSNEVVAETASTADELWPRLRSRQTRSLPRLRPRWTGSEYAESLPRGTFTEEGRDTSRVASFCAVGPQRNLSVRCNQETAAAEAPNPMRPPIDYKWADVEEQVRP